MKSKEILFLLPKQTLNEATIHYVDIVKAAFEQAGYSIVESDDLKASKKYAHVFVMSAKWCFLAKIINPKIKVVTWFQGLGGEEALMTRNSKRDKMIWSMLERFAIKFSWLNIYVSESMKKYYTDSYKMNDKNYFIMPCFNKPINLDAFEVLSKYDKPSFVYAGGLDEWQCVDKTLQLYSLIEQALPEASITLLTKQKDEANSLLKKYNIKNGKVDFVSLDELDSELEKYKYGFLIRNDHIVNNVSTPTKMNSYLANGIIPIYTDVVDDFNRHFENQDFILLNVNKIIQSWAETIIREHTSTVDIDSYRNDVISLFNYYYSRDTYISRLSKKLAL